MNHEDPNSSNSMRKGEDDRIVLEHHDLPSLDTMSGLADTSKYFVDALAKAKLRADELSSEMSRRSDLALKEIGADSSDTLAITHFKKSDEFRRLRSRVCEAEKNVVIERDRYGRLLTRHSKLSETRADDAKRIEWLQSALSEYQKINETLARQLEQQGQTLERLVLSMRYARGLLSRRIARTPNKHSNIAGRPEDVEWSRGQLKSAINMASKILDNFDDHDQTPSDRQR